MTTLLFIFVVGLLPVVAVIVVRFLITEQLAADRIALSLGFPRTLTAEQVQAFLDSLSALDPGPWRRWLVPPVVVFEVEATAGVINHRLLLPRRLLDRVEPLMRSAVPGLRFTIVDISTVTPTVARALCTTSRTETLRTDNAAGITTATLASLLPLAADERLVLQLVVAAAGVQQTHLPNTPWTLRALAALGFGQPPAPPKPSKRQRTGPSCLVSFRLGATAASTGRADQLLQRPRVALAATAAPGVRLRWSTLPSFVVRLLLERRQLPVIAYPMTLTSAELAPLVAWPIDGPALPGLSLGAARQLPPSPLVPSSGFVLGKSNYPGAERPIAISERALAEHILIVGPTGAGKTALEARLAADAINADYSVITVDTKGRELSSEVLRQVEPAHAPNVCVLDPSSRRPVGLNLLDGITPGHGRGVDQLGTIFARTFAFGWGAQSDDLFRVSLATVAYDPSATICDIPVLLHDERYRNRLVSKITDPTILTFWRWYVSLSPAERNLRTAPLGNKIRQWTTRPELRAMVGQADPRFRLTDIVERPGALVVDVDAGTNGESTTALVVNFVVSQLWQHVQARRSRHLIVLVIDELHRLAHLPMPFGDMLATARSFNLAVVAATQHLGQLPSRLQHDALVNCRSRLTFRCQADDARRLSRDWSGYLTADDLMGLPQYEAAGHLSLGSTVSPPLTLRTLPPGPTLSSPGDIRALSRARFGRDRSEVEAVLRQRLTGQPSTPRDRRRRTT